MPDLVWMRAVCAGADAPIGRFPDGTVHGGPRGSPIRPRAPNQTVPRRYSLGHLSLDSAGSRISFGMDDRRPRPPWAAPPATGCANPATRACSVLTCSVSSPCASRRPSACGAGTGRSRLVHVWLRGWRPCASAAFLAWVRPPRRFWHHLGTSMRRIPPEPYDCGFPLYDVHERDNVLARPPDCVRVAHLWALHIMQLTGLVPLGELLGVAERPLGVRPLPRRARFMRSGAGPPLCQDAARRLAFGGFTVAPASLVNCFGHWRPTCPVSARR